MKKGLIVMFAMTLAFTFMFVGAPAVEAMDTSTEENVIQSGPGPDRILVTVTIPSGTQYYEFYEETFPDLGHYRGVLERLAGTTYHGWIFRYPLPYPTPW